MVSDDTLRSGAAANGIPAGRLPTDDDRYWLGAMRLVMVESMRAAHLAAFAVLVVALASWLLVTGVLLFRLMPMDRLTLAMWLLPVGWWTASIAWALRVFSLRRYRYFSNSPDSAHKAVIRISRRKADQLFWAIACWLAGVVAFVVAVTYLVMNT